MGQVGAGILESLDDIGRGELGAFGRLIPCGVPGIAESACLEHQARELRPHVVLDRLVDCTPAHRAAGSGIGKAETISKPPLRGTAQIS
jgi:hypothetical protein